MDHSWKAGWGLAALLLVSAPAYAQDRAPEKPVVPFAGAYAGPEIGAHEHHFYIEQTNRVSGEMRGRYYRAWGVGGGAFLGYDLAVARKVRVGGELSVSVGGSTPVYGVGVGSFYARRPLWGLRGTGRIGYVLGDEWLVYGTFGYGAHHYRVENTAGVLDSKTGATDASSWPSSFTIGGGVEYRASSRVGVRLDFRHLDNSMSHILIGVPVRF